MDIFLYSSANVVQEIERAIRAASSGIPIRSCTTFEELRESLRFSPAFSRLIVLAPPGRGDLSNILTLADWLVGFPLILILPDSEKETISNGLKLMPRFYTFADSDLEQMVVVLLRLLDKEMEKQQKWTEAHLTG